MCLSAIYLEHCKQLKVLFWLATSRVFWIRSFQVWDISRLQPNYIFYQTGVYAQSAQRDTWSQLNVLIWLATSRVFWIRSFQFWDRSRLQPKYIYIYIYTYSIKRGYMYRALNATPGPPLTAGSAGQDRQGRVVKRRRRQICELSCCCFFIQISTHGTHPQNPPTAPTHARLFSISELRRSKQVI